MFSRIFQIKKLNVITPDDYQELIKQKKKHVLLDVRREDEFAISHILGANLLPLHEIETKIETLYPDKETAYILYCRSGVRSQDALKLMMHLGYQHVYDLGGIIDYPFEIETSS